MSVLEEIEELEQRCIIEVEQCSDPVAVKIVLGNLNLISVLKKKCYDKMKEVYDDYDN